MNILQIVSVATCLGCVWYLIRTRRISRNLAAIDTWVSAMNHTVNGTHFQGHGSTPVYLFYSRREGPFSISSKKLYRTTSGTFFEVEVTAELGTVTHWMITPVSTDDAIRFLEYVSDESEEASDIAAPKANVERA